MQEKEARERHFRGNVWNECADNGTADPGMDADL
jgi:hypothetical protein